MCYLLLISVFLFFPFFLYHAHSSCFPNPYPNPQAFPRSFFGSFLARILSLRDKTCDCTIVMACLWSIRFSIGVVMFNWLWNKVVILIWSIQFTLNKPLTSSCLIPYSSVACWPMTFEFHSFSVSEAHGMLQLGTVTKRHHVLQY